VRLCFLPCPPTGESIFATVHNLGYGLVVGITGKGDVWNQLIDREETLKTDVFIVFNSKRH
jgi:hypothetical protein